MASELEVGKIVAKTAATTGTSPLEVARLEVKDNGVDLAAGMGPKLAFYMPHNSASFEGAAIYAKKESATDSNEATSLSFSTIPNAFGSPVERLTIASTGLATFSNGIAFSQTDTSATGATATGTILDHFEKGTWTCNLTFGGGNTGITYTGGGSVGIYTRIGDMVYISCIVELSSKGSDTGSAQIEGLPFAVADNISATVYENSLTSSYNNVGLEYAYARQDSSSPHPPCIFLLDSNYNRLTSTDFSNSSSLRVAGWYKA